LKTKDSRCENATSLSYLFAFLFCFSGAAATRAQIMTPHYIVALTQTKDSTGTVGTITVTVSGYATVAPGVPTSTRHTPNAFLTIDGVGGTSYGAPVCASCNVYATKSVTATFDNQTDSCFLGGDDPTTGCYFLVNTNGQVICTMAGNLFSGGTNDYHSITVSFSGTPVVPQAGSASITATVTNNATSLPMTLAISTNPSITGSAVFGNGLTNMNIADTTNLVVAGTLVSSVPGNMNIIATVTVDSRKTIIGRTSFTVDYTNGAIPVDFRQTSATKVNPAQLQFGYVWSSSAGGLSALGSCRVREFVTYPGYVAGVQGRYYWTPPYVTGPNSYTNNPDTANTPVFATLGATGVTDIQGNVGFGLPPYTTNMVPSIQVFQFQCTYYQNNAWIQLYPTSGTILITRTVLNVNGTWQYNIQKAGLSNTGNLP
jgi:hypothetical protein